MNDPKADCDVTIFFQFGRNLPFRDDCCGLHHVRHFAQSSRGPPGEQDKLGRFTDDKNILSIDKLRLFHRCEQYLTIPINNLDHLQIS